MSIGFTKESAATGLSSGTVGFSAPLATWLQIITTLILAASFYFSHVQKSSDDAATLTAQQANVQQKLSDHDKSLLEMNKELAKIDGKLDIILGQQAKQKTK
jgi:hypothetical protein